MIVSHGYCPDGLVSAHLACKKYPDAIVHFTTERNMRLDKYFPDVRGARLLILDYCYPFEVLQELASSALSVCVYDHHKTAIEDINSRITSTHEIEHICQTVLDEKTKVHFTLRNLEVLIDTQFCASEIVSNRLQIDCSYLHHIRDRDLWEWKHENSRAFSECLYSRGLTFESLKWIESTPLNEVYAMGKKLLEYRDFMVDEIAKKSDRVRLSNPALAIAKVTPPAGMNTDATMVRPKVADGSLSQNTHDDATIAEGSSVHVELTPSDNAADDNPTEDPMLGDTVDTADEKYILAVESTLLQSDVGNKMLDDPQCLFAVIYRWSLKKNKWYVSLRSSNDREDVSQIAKAHGGGGHRCAAGFEIDSIRDFITRL